jgi:hypothetical protein
MGSTQLGLRGTFRARNLALARPFAGHIFAAKRQSEPPPTSFVVPFQMPGQAAFLDERQPGCRRPRTLLDGSQCSVVSSSGGSHNGIVTVERPFPLLADTVTIASQPPSAMLTALSTFELFTAGVASPGSSRAAAGAVLDVGTAE